MERAATTASSLEAEQDSEAQSRFEAASKQSNDPPLSRVNTLRSGEDNMKLMELMAHCTKLSDIVSKNRKRDVCMKNRQSVSVRKRNKRIIMSLKTERELVRIKIDDGNAFWEEIRVNTGVFKLMLLSLKVNAVRLNFLLPFWVIAKVKTVNGEHQLQALVDKKKVIITETSNRSDLNLEDACGIDCLPTATIFEELARMGWLHTDSHSTPSSTKPSSSKPRKVKVKEGGFKGIRDNGPTEAYQ
ncbi:hypothetical protein Tco_0439958 [Tanacetum coccineum]